MVEECVRENSIDTSAHRSQLLDGRLLQTDPGNVQTHKQTSEIDPTQGWFRERRQGPSIQMFCRDGGHKILLVPWKQSQWTRLQIARDKKKGNSATTHDTGFTDPPPPPSPPPLSLSLHPLPFARPTCSGSIYCCWVERQLHRACGACSR